MATPIIDEYLLDRLPNIDRGVRLESCGLWWAKRDAKICQHKAYILEGQLLRRLPHPYGFVDMGRNTGWKSLSILSDYRLRIRLTKLHLATSVTRHCCFPFGPSNLKQSVIEGIC